ncbi:hypothetical protein [Sphingobacterium anhuiense]|uniref:hypothetical protein n=1 Tax=Sphingobacterium anhuiense TaxID=493780 RepID=UPI003C2D0444
MMLHNQASAQKAVNLYFINLNDKKPIESVNATLRLQDITFKSDKNGKIKIPYNLNNNLGKLKVTHLSYNDSIISLPIVMDTIFLQSKNILLKEVEIPNNVINKIEYQKFTDSIFENSYNINELIKQSPGFVLKDNQLYYKGNKVKDIMVNGKPFFPIAGTQIFDLMPANIVKEFKISTSNLDSINNTISKTESVNLDIHLNNDKNQGLFGNVYIGIGSKDRYLLSNNLFKYNTKYQNSIQLNHNNVNITETLSKFPTITNPIFYTDETKTNGVITHENNLKNGNKININILGNISKIKEDNLISRNDLINNITSESKVLATTKNSEIRNTGVTYKHNLPENSYLTLSSTINAVRQNRSSNSDFLIKTIDSTSQILLNQEKTTNEIVWKNKIELNYRKKESKNFLLTEIEHNYNPKYISESNYNPATLDQIKAKNTRKLYQNIINASSKYNINLNRLSYLKLGVLLNHNKIYYSEKINQKSTSDLQASTNIVNMQLTPIVETYINIKKLSATLSASYQYYQNKNDSVVLNLENNFLYNSEFNYILNNYETINFNLKKETFFPTADQLTNINNTYDPIYQFRGNSLLRSEIKNSTEFSISTNRIANSSISLNVNLNQIKNKIGYMMSQENLVQINKLLNFGRTIENKVFISSYTALKKSQLISSVFYNHFQNPIQIKENIEVINNVNYGFSQSLDYEITKALSISPSIRYNRLKNSLLTNKMVSNQLTISNQAKLEYKLFSLNLIPVLNSTSSSNETTWNFVTSLSANYLFNKIRLNFWVATNDFFNSYNPNLVSFNTSYQESRITKAPRRFILFGVNKHFGLVNNKK